MRAIHPDINTPLPSNQYDWENIILFQNKNNAKKIINLWLLGAFSLIIKEQEKLNNW